MTPDTRKISPAHRVCGTVRLPGDKSISHRYAMLGAVAEGTTTIDGFATSADCQSTLDCLQALGIEVRRDGNHITILGRGLHGMSAPSASLDAGNSGSTMRMLAGLLAGQPFTSRLTGDASLSRRPMNRIIDPLTQMGARISSAPGGLPPLEIEGQTPLQSIHYKPPVASAQVKTAVLFAGLLATNETTVVEPVSTRNHTEIALEQLGAAIWRDGDTIGVRAGTPLRPIVARVPGDISSAAFFLAAVFMLPGSEISLIGVGLNPTRTAMLDLLESMGARLDRTNLRLESGEATGDLHASYGLLEGGEIPGDAIPNLIDELPVLAVLGTRMKQGLRFHGAQELRVKESDRLRAVAGNLQRMGVDVEEFPDGLSVPGGQTLQHAEIDTFGDHRIAMAFAVAGLAAHGGVTIRGSDCVAVSFPGFFETLDHVSEY
jgi:3-phosphoshikimate 1-carboxyvinyltransferase